MRLSELNEDQKSHLAWRLDHNTCCGLLTASAVARGDHGDLDLVEIFKTYGDRSEHSAKILARKVANFVTDPQDKEAVNLTLSLLSTVQNHVRHLDTKRTIFVYEQLIASFKSTVGLYKTLHVRE